MLSVFDFASHLFVHWHVYAAFPANPFRFSRANFHYFFGLFYFFFNTFHLVCFCNVLMLLGSLGITLSVVGHLRVAQITAYCANYLTKRVNTSSSKSEPGKHPQQQQQHQQKKMYVNFTPANFSVFLRQVDGFLVALADANRVAGLAIFGFVMTNLPMNALIILMLAKGAIASENMRRITVAFVAVQLGFIFALTFFFAMLSLKLHRPVKLVMGCSVAEIREKKEEREKRIVDGNLLHKRMLKIQVQKQIRRWPLPDRLKLHRYIETFHTERQFTVQYGRYGAVTFASQGKVGFRLVN